MKSRYQLIIIAITISEKEEQPSCERKGKFASKTDDAQKKNIYRLLSDEK